MIHPDALEEAVARTAELLGSTAKTVIVVGAKLLQFGSAETYRKLMEASHYLVAFTLPHYLQGRGG